MAGLAAYSAYELDIDDVNQLSAIAMIVPKELDKLLPPRKLVLPVSPAREIQPTNLMATNGAGSHTE